MWNDNPKGVLRFRAALLASTILVVSCPTHAQPANTRPSPSASADPAATAAAADASKKPASDDQVNAVDPTKDAAAPASSKEIVIQGPPFPAPRPTTPT